MWNLVAEQLGIDDEILRKSSSNLLSSFKENNLKTYQQSEKLAEECIKSNFTNCGLYDKEFW